MEDIIGMENYLNWKMIIILLNILLNRTQTDFNWPVLTFCA